MKRLLASLTLLGIVAASMAQAATVVVHSSDLSSGSPCGPGTCTYAYTHPVWFFYNDTNDFLDNSLGSFVVGPGTPLTGRGGAQISVTGSPQRRNLATYQFGGTLLSSITSLKFTTYNPSAGNAGSANRSAYLNFNTDFNGSNTFQRRLVWVPSVNGAVAQNTWKEWDTINGGNGLWIYSGATWPAPNAVAGTTPKTWTQILTDYPGARILPSDPWLGMRVGEPYPDSYTEDIDNFTIGISGNSTTFDFEPGPFNVISPAAPPTCITPTFPCVTVPVNIARTDAVGVRAFSVTVQLSANLALCTGATSDVTQGTYLNSVGSTNYQVVSNGGGSYTVDCSILGATAGATAASGNLFNLSLKNVGGNGTGTVTITSTTLRDPNNATIFSDPGSPASVTIDNTSPSQLSGLTATQQRTGNPAGQVTKINLAWSAPEAGASVQLFRKGFGSYPEYDDNGGAAPGAPGAFPPAGWSYVAAVPSGTTTYSDYSETNNINFEAPTYTTGSPNGQDGWSRTGSYDHNIDGSFGYGTFGAQSLRISNATTSGSFGDQTFAKPLANAVGELSATAGAFSVGNRRGQFEVQFDLAAITSTPQPMLMSMSPDRGDGSRMSYLRFENTGSALDVFFDDVQGTTNPANFVETQIATGLNSAVPHRFRLSLTTLEGPSNDIVKVWIDGALVHTGTSWENYYRYDSEASAEQSTRIVKTVIFRTAGTAEPANSGKGLLIDNMSLSSSTDFASRDFWYYAAYVQDGCGNYSPAAGPTSGTLNYHLGDVSNGITAGTGNNAVFTEDLSLLGSHYGITLVPNDTWNMLDVGPTTTNYIDGRPTTDNKVGFEDLILFAINYNQVSAPSRINGSAPVAADRNDLTIDAPSRVTAGQIFTVTLRLSGAGDLHGISTQLGWDRAVAVPEQVEAGALASAQNAMVLSSGAGNVDAAVLGPDAGFLGNGALATVKFRALANGDPQLSLASVDARDGANHKVAFGAGQTPVTPARTAFAPAKPNPFARSTTLSFTLAKSGAVELAVFSVDGRKVATLVNGSKSAGAYQMSWDGRGQTGQPARPGLYFARLTTGEGRFTRTLVLNK